MTKRLILYIVCLLFVMPIWAWQETVTVGAGLTQTLPTSVDSRVQGVADALGLTLLGWTPGEIADGQRPTTYYGLGATVTPDVETTYYAMFARANEGGEVMIRQCASPADGDAVLLAVTAASDCWVASSTQKGTGNVNLYAASASYSASLLKHTIASTNTYLWKFVEQEDNKFNLQSVTASANYLIANGSYVQCNSSGNKNFRIQNGFLYGTASSVYLTLKSDSYGFYWSPENAAPKNQSFAFYRKERYVDFATEIGQLPGCANCFIYVP